MAVPELRVSTVNSRAVREDGEFVLYWMTSARRTAWNFGLDRALDEAERLGKPLVVLEALRTGYRWASDRLHAFVLHGMADNARALSGTPLLHYPYVEPEPGAGSGLLEALGKRACLIVTDDYPCFFLPRMVTAAGRKLDVRLEAVDSNGLLPLRAPERSFTTAFSLRAFLQKNLAPHLDQPPAARPLEERQLVETPRDLLESEQSRWPAARPEVLEAQPGALAALPIDHDVKAIEGRGGREVGLQELETFLQDRLPHYHESRNDPVSDVASGLSPYLHFGHLSVHEIFARLVEREGSWSTGRLDPRGNGGKREGWWQLRPETEAFLDELVTWRELGFLFGHRRPHDYDAFESLPDFAKTTLREHAEDERPHVYTLAEFEEARTHDDLWNAAQRQLVREGKIHNYLRMLWGKKILHWSRTPQEALEVMIELNNKYALDGRDPNSYSGIFWVLGRFDRAWGPERPIFGKVRYMASENTRRKLNVKPYLASYAAQGELFA